MSIGIPVKVLHEAEGHIVTIEMKSGELYRGKLVSAEDNMNCHMQEVSHTARDGKVTSLEAIYIRGSNIRFMILPDMLKNAPMFKRDPNAMRGRGIGRGNRGVFRGHSGRGGFRGANRGTRAPPRPRMWVLCVP